MHEVIIVGGSFDPVHKDHINIANIASKNLGIDEVWFLLANNPRWKEEVTSFEHRYQMLSLVIKDYPKYRIALDEKDVTDTNYTIDTAYRMINRYPSIKFYYLIGSDQLERLHEWKNIDELSQLFQFVHVRRQNIIVNRDNLSKYNVIDIDIEPLPASSTEVREGNLDFVDPRVKQYILSHYLYLSHRLKQYLSPRRYEHSVRVATLAKEIASANHYDEEKAFAAGILHDCAKERDYKTVLQYMKQYFPQHLGESPQIYHQYVGSIIAKEIFYVEDQEILTAISNHATASKTMATLDKIIYCADKLEEGRNNNTDALIERCKKGIHGAFRVVLKQNIDYLRSQNIPIVKQTLDCYDYLSDHALEHQLHVIVKTLDMKKAEDIVIIDVSQNNPLTHYYVLCTASSTRQTMALANEVDNELDKEGFNVHHIEGRGEQKWILVDAKDIIIHIFTIDYRQIYDFESMLKDQPFIPLNEVLNNEE